MATLDKWKEKLLDLGKRNKLINYKDSNGSLDVVYPNTDAVFNKITGETPSFEVFDIDSFLPKNDKAEDTKLPDIKDIIKKNIKRNQIVLYKKDFTTKDVLKFINRKAKESILEKGINVLYMAFGFVNWKETDNSIIYKAPLVLVPIKITNESALSPFYIEQYEDEAITNPTFTYKMSSEYNIKLPQIGEDQSIEEYLAQVNGFITGLGWSVTNEIKIAVFSFLKLNMYLDLKNNENAILQNSNVKALLGEKINPEAVQSVKTISTGLHNVVDADSSQIDAIKLAKEGANFVLQGPPGTGKSQTITNIIAECLSEGKKVLFVSEKLAALNVVYNNLKRVQLDDFCLELHSHKTNKKEVIYELNRVLAKSKSSISNKATQELTELYNSRKQLDDYADTLHKQIPVIDMSPYQLYSEIAELNDIPEIEYVIPKIETKGLDHLNISKNILNRYIEFSKTIGCNYADNEWYGYKNSDTSYEFKINLKNNLNSVNSLFLRLQQISASVSKETFVFAINIKQIEVIKNAFLLLSGLDYFTPKIFDKNQLPKIIETFAAMQKASVTIGNICSDLNAVFNENFYKLDGKKLYSNFIMQYTKKFLLFNKNYRQDKSSIDLCLKNPKTRLNFKNTATALKKLKTVQELKLELKNYEPLAKEILGECYKKNNTSWETVIKTLGALLSYLNAGLDLAYISKFNSAQFFGYKPRFIEYYQIIKQLLSANELGIEFIERCFDASVFNIRTERFEKVIDKTGRCLTNFDLLENWIRFYKLLQETKENEIDKFIDCAIGGKVQVENYTKLYSLLFYKQWVYSIFSRNEILANFDRISQDKCVAVFSEKDKLQFEISKALINAKLSSLRPNTEMLSPGSQVSTLLREGEKKRKQMPVRILLSKISELILTLKPCFLMSPLSVSAFLDADTIKFDVVIFDEASQIFPEDALGAIYRAKQVIVVGDSKQMPPSNFFNATMTEDEYNEDDYSEDITDFESILDICSTCYRQNRLKWHYRSRTEDLIAFSNKNFYNGELVTFPSARKKENFYGVDYRYIPDGIFDRTTKTNQIEAERVADLVFENFVKFPERSLGVVAFSQPQQDAIEDIISKRREKDPSFEKFFKDGINEPFFVKNLETVQGDERDTIIFSVGYAKDKAGKFLHNFGPLNRQGGERRLNVAVTRAKYNVRLVASIRYFDIDLKHTNSEGARLLKEYLDYAENGSIALQRNLRITPGENPDLEFESEVCDFLRESGFSVDMQVGSSGYKINLAVKHPDTEAYVLAVECDGATYHSVKSTRDRDRLRREILERLGWKFYRIWSTDWLKNNRVEKQRLLEAVKNSIVNPQKSPSGNTLPPAEKAEKPDSFIEVKNYVAPAFKTYNEVDAYSVKHNGDFLVVLNAIVAAESPVSEEWVMKRTVKLFERDKVTTVTKKEFNAWKSRSKNIYFKDGYMYSSSQTTFELRIPAEGHSPRDIKYIAIEELASGMEVIIKQNIEVTIDGLFKTLANILGFSRIGDAINSRLEKAIDYLKKQGKIMVTDDAISLKNIK